MRPTVALILGGMAVAMMLVAACDAVAPASNDLVPLSDDLAAIVNSQLSARDRRLSSTEAQVPPIAPTTAVEIAGKELLAELESNRVPAQDPSAPDGLVRRVVVGLDIRPTSVWVVVYRWAAGFDCRSPLGGPGPCAVISFYLIDDRTGELIHAGSHTQG